MKLRHYNYYDCDSYNTYSLIHLLVTVAGDEEDGSCNENDPCTQPECYDEPNIPWEYWAWEGGKRREEEGKRMVTMQ